MTDYTKFQLNPLDVGGNLYKNSFGVQILPYMLFMSSLSLIELLLITKNP